VERTTPAPPETAPRPSSLAVPTLGTVTVVTVPMPAARTGKRVAGFLSRNRTVVLFALLLIGTDLAVGRFAAVWEAHSPDDYAARLTGCAREPRDLVFVGGSPVAEGIDPDRIAGVTWHGKPLASAYAMGLSGGTTSDFYHAVIHGCPTPPRVLVYGITASDLNDSRHEPHGPYSLMTWSDLAGWVRLRPEAGEWAVRHFVQGRLQQASNLFRYRHGIRMWAATQADRQIPGSCPESMREADELRERAEALRTGNGYAPAWGFVTMRHDAAKAAGVGQKELPYLHKYRTGSHLKYLHRLIDWCEAGGVELVLLDMPVTADLEAMYAAEFAEYRGRLAEVERDRGMRVIRATRAAVGLSDAHFADLIHMNRDGAARFSAWVRESLSRDPKGSARPGS
jgi:hypothetical protein